MGAFGIKKLGKKIRLRRKKDKQKTENRAKKALKTISFILGAFVTCWTPYHIIAIVASFCPSCINVHIYMVSYFLCYLNSPVNPFCYAAANQQFKNAFKRIMTGDLSLKWCHKLFKTAIYYWKMPFYKILGLLFFFKVAFKFLILTYGNILK